MIEKSYSDEVIPRIEISISHLIEKSLLLENPEDALEIITSHVVSNLGDKSAHLRPGGLREGEEQYVFLGRHWVMAMLFLQLF